MLTNALHHAHGPPASRTHRLAWAVGLASLPLGCLLLATNDPSDGGIFPPCPFRTLTGLDCPGCGTTRAMHRLLRGDVASAADLNVLSVAAVPVMLWATVSAFLVVVRGRGLPRIRLPAWTIWGLVALVVVFAVGRNLPVASLRWLSSVG